MKLQFMFLTDERFKNKIGEFEVKNLKVSEGNQFVEYDKVNFSIDGEDYDGSIANFVKYMTDTDLFRSVLNAYLMGSPDFKFLDGWEIFTEILSSKTYIDGIMTSFALIESDEVVTYRLLLAVPGIRFYSADGDYYLTLDEDNIIQTDVETFWFSALIETLAEIRLGKERLLYKSEYLNEEEYEDLIQETINDMEKE